MKEYIPLSPKQSVSSLCLFIGIILCIPLLPSFSQEGIVISGVAESTVVALLDTGDSWNFAAEQYANFRVAAPVGDTGMFHAAFNVFAVATPETGIETEGELERLYVLFRFDASDVYTGLLRIPFGYGMGIRPTDIVNPQNPLFPDARLQGVLASLVAWYPKDEVRVQGFAAQRSNESFGGQSITFSGESLFGLSLDHHNPLISLQGLAMTTIPGESPDAYLLHFGLSLKFDAAVGVALDALVTTDGKSEFAEGRENAAFTAALGCDYSFFDGKLFILLQYFYTSAGLLSGDESVSDFLEVHEPMDNEEISFKSLQNSGTTYLRRHYGYLTALYNHSDYARLQVSVLASLLDTSFFSTVRHEFEPAQGVTLISMLAVPLDQTVFDKSSKGALGPDVTGLQIAASFSVKYRF